MPLQRRIVVAALVATPLTFAAQATLAEIRADQLASVTYGASAFDEPFAHIEPSPAPAEPAPAEVAPAAVRAPAAAAPVAKPAVPSIPSPAEPSMARPAEPSMAKTAGPSMAKPAEPSMATPTEPTLAKPAPPRSMKAFESPLIDPTLPIPEPVILSEPDAEPDAERAEAPVAPMVRVPTAAERAAALARIRAAQAEAEAAAEAPVELAAASAEPPAVIRSAPARAATLPPKVVDVPQESATPRRRHFAVDREKLMREFPDELVESLWIQDWQDIERGYMFGRLVDVPSDPEGRGIVLRLDGESRIGELTDDPYRQMLLCKLAKPAAGLLYRIASRLRMIEGEAYEPLEITSLVRTWDYQVRLTDVNPNADRTRDGVPPTHVLGLAFDIARSSMSVERQERIESLLDQLALEGELAYYKEGSHNGLRHYHVMALPSANFELARHYEREQDAIERRQEAQARHRTLPDAPCVMFGNSLEPFSAICSCELPVEVSTASLAAAPISR